MINLEKIKEKLIVDSIYENDGTYVPRVSNILSMLHEEYLMKWANGIGFRHKDFEEERSRAAAYGTVTHNAIEAYLNNKDPESTNLAFEGFLYWWNTINKEGNFIEILGQEETLTCPYYGGTYDLLLRINGRIYLVDFKTSNHVGYKYFLQLSAYRQMLRYNKGIEIDGCIVLQLNKSKIQFHEYLLDFAVPEHKYFMDVCEATFERMAETYYFWQYTRQLYDVVEFRR